MRRVVNCVLAIGILAGLPATARADWGRLRTANFLFIGDASDRQLRETARKLEQFREVMLRALPDVSGISAVPTVVIVFQRDRSFTPFKPQFQGRTTDVAGFFLGSEDVNYLAVNIEHGEVGFSTVFHEYSHFLVANSLGNVPVWASEGLAQFYESFEEQDGGRVALIGTPIDHHIAVLRENTPIPIRDLIAIDSKSPIYNEGNRRGVFYAQSWALMHYLILGNKARTPQFLEYLTLMQGGTASGDAFSKAFGGGPAALDQELRNYVSGVSMTRLRMTFDDRVNAAVPERVDKIDDFEADTYLGDLQARLDRVDEAQARLKRVLQQRPGTARATLGLGLIELRADRLASALPLLERAAAEGPDDGQVQAALGRALMSSLITLTPASEQYTATLKRARAALTRAVELDPDSARSAAFLGYAELIAGEDLARAATLLTRAITLAPSRDDHRLMLAQVFLQQGELIRATDLLGSMIANANNPDARQQARELMGRVAAARNAAIKAAAAPVSATPASAAAAPRDESASTRPEAESAAATPGGRRYIFSLRPIKAGETRVMGLFKGLVCGRELVVLAVETPGRLLQLRQVAARPPEFIAYVPNPPSSVSCGPINPPQRVLATYIPAATPTKAFDGDVVAIELIPDDFTLP
jgi:tetratricopeptide (TPR) repeat protein